MNVYILVNEWCNSTESGYDILNTYESKEDAINAMHKAYSDFIKECNEKQVSDFEEYTTEKGIEEQRFGDRQYCREPRTQRQPLNPERPELLGDS